MDININFLVLKEQDLKTQFNLIKNNFVGERLTMSTLQEIDYKFKDLFHKFGLYDLQYTLDKDDWDKGIITFTPLRQIDVYAIKGILEI